MAHKSYKAKQADPFTFDIDGQPTPPFRSRGGIGSIMLELGELAHLRNLDAESPEALAAIAKVFSMLLGPTEYERFREHVAANSVDVDTLLEILADMFAGVVGSPLPQPPDSSPGPTKTARTYKVISPSDGTVTEIPLTPEREAELIAAMEADLHPTEPGGS